ncbi:hypothetical protein GOP56_06895 [Brevibacillus sp. 7WMA2]|uniref:hypothetical protein n=1 Tax=Brevibacillus sp. 7WMA2 TaxID=2683193 RepID=UPI0013A79E70|nr:hypothetical protein [Brevibacillus sp. 7WMA2]QIC05351.1 hypothetical protein GOP56_06895 [Brevibacillus sp. 7WMA2]
MLSKKVLSSFLSLGIASLCINPALAKERISYDTVPIIKSVESDTGNLDVAAVSMDDLLHDKELLQAFQSMVEDEKPIYVYGDKLDLHKLDNFFELGLSENAKGIDEYQVIAIKKKGERFKLDYAKVDIISDDKNTYNRSSALNNKFLKEILQEQYQKRNKDVKLSPYELNDFAAIGDDTFTSYVKDKDGNKISEMYVSYDAYRDIKSKNSKSDYFYVDNIIQLDTVKGSAMNDSFEFKAFQTGKNVLKKFSPDTDKDSSSFTVSLPWGISWSFETGGKISLTVDGNYSDGDVKWNVKTPWNKLSLPDKVSIQPGIAISAPKSDKWFELNQYLTANVIYKGNMYKHSMRVYVDERKQ